MARPREFDEEDLLEKAMSAFWERGLQATSMRQIEAATGVKQVSLYNAFGDKEGLFLAVLDRYASRVAEALDRHLENRGLDGIAALANSIVTPESGFPNNSFGCLMVNTTLAGELGGAAVRERVDGCRIMVRVKIRDALARAKSRRGLNRGLKIEQCAELIVAAFWGIFVTMRLASDQTAGKPAVDALTRMLRDWRAKAL